MSESVGDHHEHERSAILKAVLVNAGIAAVTLATGFLGRSSAMIGEALHDGIDALTHGTDYYGHKSSSDRTARAARKISALGITGAAFLFTCDVAKDFGDTGHSISGLSVPIAIGAAAANYYIHRQFECGHGHSNSNFRGSSVHAKVDAVLSPLVASGVIASYVTGSSVFDRLAALAAGVGTFVGNAGELRAAFSRSSSQD